MSKSKFLYVLDLTIAVAFVLSILSGLVFLLGDQQGGQAILGLSRDRWRDLHIWVSVVMGSGAIIHIALHWSWLARMTKRLFGLGADGKKALQSSRGRLFFAIDSVIGLSFVLSMLTGLAFFLLGFGGYQGGRNPSFRTALAGLSRTSWSDLHTLFSLVMLGGVALHFALHLKWIFSMSGRMVRTKPARQTSPVRVSAE